MMVNRILKHSRLLLTVVAVCGIICLPQGATAQTDPPLASLLPQVEPWGLSEEPQNFFPENLFEYINGAAEIYLSYDFHELIVAQYAKKDSESALAVEIYDMGSPTNGFGIYSAERYPENTFSPIGVQGYLEEGSLNFLVGRYYVKLLCFDCGDTSDRALRSFAEGIVSHVGDQGGFPEVLGAFPDRGRLANTEKFILNNVMGYGFLHNGFLTQYRVGDQTFDCFVIVGEDAHDAEQMLTKYLEAKGSANVQAISNGFHIKDRYYHNIYVGRLNRHICGVMKIQEGSEALGREYLTLLLQNLK
jgi:hypothetical protein